MNPTLIPTATFTATSTATSTATATQMATGSAGRRLRRIVLAVLVAAVTSLGLGLPQASAYTHVAYGSAGWVTPSQVIGTHFPVPCGYGPYQCVQPGIMVNEPLAYRSSATTGLQRVQLTTVVHRWSNGWHQEIVDRQTITLYAGVQYGRFANRSWLLNTGGAKYVTHAVQWIDPYGRVLGTRGIAMYTAGDYICQTRISGCTAYAGFVTVVTS